MPLALQEKWPEFLTAAKEFAREARERDHGEKGVASFDKLPPPATPFGS